MRCCVREKKDDETLDEEQMNFKTKIGQFISLFRA